MIGKERKNKRKKRGREQERAKDQERERPGETARPRERKIKERERKNKTENDQRERATDQERERSGDSARARKRERSCEPAWPFASSLLPSPSPSVPPHPSPAPASDCRRLCVGRKVRASEISYSKNSRLVITLAKLLLSEFKLAFLADSITDS